MDDARHCRAFLTVNRMVIIQQSRGFVVVVVQRIT